MFLTTYNDSILVSDEKFVYALAFTTGPLDDERKNLVQHE